MSFFRGSISTLLSGVLLLLSSAGPALAHFERVVTSARSLSLGGAFVGTANDPSAAVINPAGLARIGNYSFLTTYQKPYGLADLDEGYAAAALPLGFGVAGISWHHLGMRGAVAEDYLSVAFGRDLVHNTQDASLSVGASLDLARVSVDLPGGAASVLTGGFGVLLRPFPAVGLGYTMGNVRQGEFDISPGGGKTKLARTQAWGLSLQWHNRVTLSLEKTRDMHGEWGDHAGLEIIMAPSLVLRSGLNGRHAVAGVGVRWAGLSVDVGTASHEYLGSTYILSLGYSPPKETGNNAQTQ